MKGDHSSALLTPEDGAVVHVVHAGARAGSARAGSASSASVGTGCVGRAGSAGVLPAGSRAGIEDQGANDNDNTTAEDGAPVVLVCEHASSYIPSGLADLGLTADARYAHIAWDIGAYDLAVALGRLLNAPLVASDVSRLVYDCNRPLEDKSATPAVSEVFEVPGNQALSAEQRQQRYNQVYLPFEQMVDSQINLAKASKSTAASADSSPQTATRTGKHPPTNTSLWRLPVLVTVHSFTPVYRGQTRDVEIGLLHDVDGEFAIKLHDIASGKYGNGWYPADTESLYKVDLNQPYSASDGVLHTLLTHARPKGLAHVMIEVNNKLIRDASGVEQVAQQLNAMIRYAIKTGPG